MFQLVHVAPFKLSSGSFSRHYCVLKIPSFFSVKETILSKPALLVCILLTMNANVPEKKTKYNPRLNRDTVLGWLQPTPEMGLASGFETYLTAHCSYQKKGK